MPRSPIDTKRAQQPPAEAGGEPASDPAATAPDPARDSLADTAPATGLNKYFSASLQALTGGTMDAPVADLPIIVAPANPVRPDPVARDADDAPALDARRGRTRLLRHRRMTFVSAAPRE